MKALEELGKFDLVYADPPWRYQHSVSDSREIENQYPTMTLDDICALPIQKLSNDNSILFIWITSPKLDEGMRVIRDWGFEYKTCAVWVKDKIGMGYYFRQQHELLCIGTKGSPGTPDPTSRISSILQFPRGNHSAKPEKVYEIIESMYPKLSKVELFARHRREGWESWGNHDLEYSLI